MTSLNTTEPADTNNDPKLRDSNPLTQNLGVTADTTDAELREQLEAIVWKMSDYRPGESYGEDQHVESLVVQFVVLIHAHSLALLDRVEKEVIGKDDMDGTMPLDYQPNNLRQRNYLRAEQRTALATIKGKEKT